MRFSTHDQRTPHQSLTGGPNREIGIALRSIWSQALLDHRATILRFSKSSTQSLTVGLIFEEATHTEARARADPVRATRADTTR